MSSVLTTTATTAFSTQTADSDSLIELKASTLRQAIVQTLKTHSTPDDHPFLDEGESLCDTLERSVERANKNFQRTEKAQSKQTIDFLAFGVLLPLPLALPELTENTLGNNKNAAERPNKHYIFYGRLFNLDDKLAPFGACAVSTVNAIKMGSDSLLSGYVPPVREAKAWLIDSKIADDALIMPTAGEGISLPVAYLTKSSYLNTKSLSLLEIESPKLMEALIVRGWRSLYWPELFVHADSISPDSPSDSAQAVFLPSIMQACAACAQLTHSSFSSAIDLSEVTVETMTEEDEKALKRVQSESSKNIESLLSLYDTQAARGSERIFDQRPSSLRRLERLKGDGLYAVNQFYRSLDAELSNQELSFDNLINALCLRKASSPDEFAIRKIFNRPVQSLHFFELALRQTQKGTVFALLFTHRQVDAQQAYALHTSNDGFYGFEPQALTSKPLCPLATFESKADAQAGLENLKALQGTDEGLRAQAIYLMPETTLFQTFHEIGSKLKTFHLGSIQ